nr:MAG TPA: hypothetical protein [Bacteriophage sp.]
MWYNIIRKQEREPVQQTLMILFRRRRHLRQVNRPPGLRISVVPVFHYNR